MRRVGENVRDSAVPVLRVIPVSASGGITMDRDIPDALRDNLDALIESGTKAVLLVDFQDARVMTDTLVDILNPLARAVRAAGRGELLVVVVTSQPSVAAVAEMFAVANEVPLFVASSINEVTHARPVGRLTPAESDSLHWMDLLGGHVTVSGFARATDLEQTAAGNRLSNLARRGYVQRVPRSRREGDVYVSPAYYNGQTATAAQAAH